MAKIPTYQSRRTISGNVRRPSMPDYSVETGEKISKFFNKVADEEAIRKGFEEGEQEQKTSLEQNTEYLQKSNFTLKGKAYNKGATAAYVADSKTKIEKELNDAYRTITDPLNTNVAPENRYNEWLKTSEKIRTDYANSLPSELQTELSTYGDSIWQRYDNNVFNFQKNYNVDQMEIAITNRVDSFIEQAPAIINQFGVMDNTALEELYADSIAAITEGLQNINPAKAEILKDKIRATVINGAITNYFESLTTDSEKEAFIMDVRKGGDQSQAIISQLNETYFADDGKQGFSAAEFITSSNTLWTTFQKEEKLQSGELEKLTTKFNNAIAVEAMGINSGYEFDINQWSNFGKDDDEINAVKKLWENAQLAGSYVNKQKTASITEHADEVDNIKDYIADLTLQLETGKDLDGELLTETELDEMRQDIVTYKTIETSLTTSLQTKRDIIAKADGSSWQLVQDAGIELDFSSPEKIEEMFIAHKQITNTPAWNTTILPKSQLEEIKKTIEGATRDELILGENSIFAQLQSRFGKYTYTLLNELELDQTAMKHVFDFVNIGDSTTAGKIVEGFQNQKELEDGFKNIYTGEGGTEKYSEIELNFSNAFNTKYADALKSNPKLLNSLYSATYSHFLKDLQVMSPEDAIKNSINKMETAYTTISIDGNGQTLLVPNDPVAFPPDQIKAKIEDMFENPQDYPIFTGGTSTLSDFSENKTDYRVVVDGNKIFLVPAETGLIMAEVFEKLPSGKNEVVKAVPHIELDGADSEVVTADVEITQAYEKPDNWNQTFTENTATTKVVSGDVMGVPFETDVKLKSNEMVEELYKAWFTEVFRDNQLQYVDIHSGELSINNEDKLRLHAVSFYIKDGEITEWILDYLGDNIDRFDYLDNKEVRQRVLEGWSQNFIKTFKGNSGQTMSPLRALESFTKSVYTDYISQVKSKSNAELTLEGEAAKYKLGITENNLLVGGE